MPEKDTLTRYGLVEKGVAEAIPEPPKESGLFVRVFEPGEDSQWRMGALMARAKARRMSFRTVSSREVTEQMDARVAEARERGRIPVRVVGPADAVPQFLGRAGITQSDLVV